VLDGRCKNEKFCKWQHCSDESTCDLIFTIDRGWNAAITFLACRWKMYKVVVFLIWREN